MVSTPPSTEERYTIITADSHAGGSHAAYRDYLDPAYREDFDAWRERYKNPFRDLGDTRRYRNWDNDMRNSQLLEDGIVGEVIFPNTVPPFFPTFVLFAAPPKPEDYRHRLAGIRAHNRWLVDFCADFPTRRAGIGQIFVNDIDDAIEDVTFIKDHGLRGGLLLPNIPPDASWVAPLHDPAYDRLWRVIEDLEVPINVHGGTGVPNYGPHPASMLLYITEVPFYSQRPLVQFILGGVFERFPRLRFAVTESGCSWVPRLLDGLDRTLAQVTSTGRIGELRFADDLHYTLSASEYFARNVWMGVSQPAPADVAAFDRIGQERFMWGSDYPHDEGTYPFTTEHLRQVFAGRPPEVMRAVLGANAAQLYDFDLEALSPLAEQHGPSVGQLAEPLLELPDEPNEALLKGAAGLDGLAQPAH